MVIVLKPKDNISCTGDLYMPNKLNKEYITLYIDRCVSFARSHENWEEFNYKVKTEVRSWYELNKDKTFDNRMPNEIKDIIKKIAKEVLCQTVSLAYILSDIKKG